MESQPLVETGAVGALNGLNVLARTFGSRIQEARMAIGTQDLELIKQEVAGIREFYESRMNVEIPPL